MSGLQGLGLRGLGLRGLGLGGFRVESDIQNPNRFCFLNTIRGPSLYSDPRTPVENFHPLTDFLTAGIVVRLGLWGSGLGALVPGSRIRRGLGFRVLGLGLATGTPEVCTRTLLVPFKYGYMVPI